MMLPLNHRRPDHPTLEHLQPVPVGHHLDCQKAPIVGPHHANPGRINRVQRHNFSEMRFNYQIESAKNGNTEFIKVESAKY